jgi:hypothetical protein
MKILIQLLTRKFNPKIALCLLVAFFGGSLSPELINIIVDILSQGE